MTSQELQEKWEREIPGAKERFAAAARKREAEKGAQVPKRPGYVDPTVSQDVSNPAVMAQKMFQNGAMSASEARSVGANIASGVRDRRD